MVITNIGERLYQQSARSRTAAERALVVDYNNINVGKTTIYSVGCLSLAGASHLEPALNFPDPQWFVECEQQLGRRHVLRAT